LPDERLSKRESLEPSSGDVSELNPFLAQVLERVKRNERERAK
jgi:hypothetical protein